MSDKQTTGHTDWQTRNVANLVPNHKCISHSKIECPATLHVYCVISYINDTRNGVAIVGVAYQPGKRLTYM